MVSIADEKRPHAFHLCRDARDFLASFERVAGADLMTVIGRFVATDSVEACLLVGSIPLGIGTGASDVDIVVLIDDRSALRSPDGNAGHGDGVVFSGRSAGDEAALVLAEVIAVIGGAEVDFELTLAPRLGELAGRVSGPGISLTSHEIRILSRIKTGWVLTRRDPQQDLCDGLLSDNSLEVHCAVSNLVFALQDLEDARAALDDDVPLALYLGRTSVEKCFASYFASRGYAFLGSKWLRFLEHRRHAGDGAGGDEIRRLAPAGLALLFPSLDASRERAARYLGEVTAFLATIRGVIQADKAFRVAFQMCPQIYDPVPVGR